jgi:hypothetical protein
MAVTTKNGATDNFMTKVFSYEHLLFKIYNKSHWNTLLLGLL